MKETRKISWARLLRSIVALTLVLTLVLLCGCGKKKNAEEPTENAWAMGDGDGKLEAQDVVDGTTKVYGTLLNLVSGDNADTNQTVTMTGSRMEINVTLGEDLLSQVGMILAQQGLDSDVSWMEKIGLRMDANMDGDKMQTVMSVLLGDTEIVDVDMIMDMANAMCYLGVPTLNDQYIGMALDMSGMPDLNGMMSQLGEYSDLVDGLPTEQELNDLLTRYLNIALEKLSDEETYEDTLSFDDVSMDVTVTAHTVKASELLDAVEAVLEEAEDDEELEEVLDAFSEVYNEYGATQAEQYGYTWYDVDLHEELMDMIPDVLDSIDDARDSLEDSDSLTIEIYTAGNQQVGFCVELRSDGERVKCFQYNLQEGNDTAYVLEIDDTFRIEGTGTNENGITNGTYTFIVLTDGEYEVLEMEVKDFDMNAFYAGNIDGTFRFSFTDDLEDLIGYNSIINEDTVIELDVTMNAETAELVVGLYSDEDLVISAELIIKSLESETIRVPSNYVDGNDSTAMQQWLTNMNLTQVLGNLRDAGVPNALVDMLEQNLGG